MYAAVPTTMPPAVTGSVDVADVAADAGSYALNLASPKSRIFTRPSNVTITFPKAASETYKPLVHALLQTTDKAKIVTEDRPEGRKGPYKIHTTPGFSAGVSDSADEGLLGF